MKFLDKGIIAVSHVIWLTSQLFPVTCKSIDEIIVGASETSSFHLADMEAGTVRHELDMVLTLDQYNALFESSTVLSPSGKHNLIRSKRKAIRDTTYRWPNKVIPYSIVSNTFSYTDRQAINAAIAEWQNYTCITFRSATRSDKNYVSIDNGNGCYSNVGMVGGSQPLGLASGCRSKGIIVHEMGHAVGFHHEQNRPDRDNYVTIIERNIPSNVLYNFQKYPSKLVNTYGVPYDYRSIMHYGGTAFSYNGKLTIQTKEPQYQNVIGNRDGMSFYDIKLANLMYKCNDGCPDIQCPDQGFVGKDCKCWCPGSPVRLCDSTGVVQTTRKPVTRVTSPTKPCSDMNQHCKSWAEAGYCKTNNYVMTYCRSSCRSCETVVRPTGPGCKDESQNCADYKRKGLCNGSFKNIMRILCQSTCNLCDRSVRANDEIIPNAANGANLLDLSLVAIFVSFVLTLM